MAGNPTNAAVWGGADVLIAPIGTALPVSNADFGLASAQREAAVSTTSGSPTVTAGVATFTANDVGATITGTGIPAAATIIAFGSATSVTISANATATGTPTATIGATALGWTYVGLLDGGQGFEESIETESTDHEAWGFGVIATTYKGTKVTKTFTAVEENETVMGLTYDVSGMTFDDVLGTYVGDLKVRDNTERVLVAFVTTSGDNERRMITKNYATIAATSAGSESEEALQSKGFTVTIVPDANKTLYYTYKGASL